MFSFRQDLEIRRQNAIKKIPIAGTLEELLKRFNIVLESQSKLDPSKLIRKHNGTIEIIKKSNKVRISISSENVTVYEEINTEVKVSCLINIFDYMFNRDNINYDVKSSSKITFEI